MEWQQIETAPRDGTHVLAWFPEDSFYGIIYNSGDCWFLAGDGYAIDNAPSHWQRLPPPPTPRAGEGSTG